MHFNVTIVENTLIFLLQPYKSTVSIMLHKICYSIKTVIVMNLRLHQYFTHEMTSTGCTEVWAGLVCAWAGSLQQIS